MYVLRTILSILCYFQYAIGSEILCHRTFLKIMEISRAQLDLSQKIKILTIDLAAATLKFTECQATHKPYFE